MQARSLCNDAKKLNNFRAASVKITDNSIDFIKQVDLGNYSDFCQQRLTISRDVTVTTIIISTAPKLKFQVKMFLTPCYRYSQFYKEINRNDHSVESRSLHNWNSINNRNL